MCVGDSGATVHDEQSIWKPVNGMMAHAIRCLLIMQDEAHVSLVEAILLHPTSHVHTDMLYDVRFGTAQEMLCTDPSHN